MPEIKRIEPGRRFSEAVVCDGVAETILFDAFSN